MERVDFPALWRPSQTHDPPIPKVPCAILPRLTALVLAFLPTGAAEARGVSPCLPLGLSPEIERAVERVLILADRPILTRPIAAAALLPADAMPNAGIARLSAAGAGSEDAVALQSRHGMRADSPYEVSAQVYRRTLC